MINAGVEDGRRGCYGAAKCQIAEESGVSFEATVLMDLVSPTDTRVLEDSDACDGQTRRREVVQDVEQVAYEGRKA